MVEVDTKHKVRVSFQNLDCCTLVIAVSGKDKRPCWGKSYEVEIPYSYGFVVRCAGKEVAFRRPSNI